jgi:hypothetical protein
LNLTLLEHKFVQSARIDARETSYWNPLPTAIPNLLARFTQVTNVKASYSTILPTQGTLDNAHVMFLACGKETPVFNDVMIEAITEAMKKKTFLIIDDGYERKDREFVYENFTKEFLEKIGKQLSDSYRLEQVSPGHALYGDLSSTAQQSIPKSSTVMLGLTVTGELVAVGVMNSLYQKWEGSANMTPELREEALRLGTNLLIYGGSKKSSVERE